MFVPMTTAQAPPPATADPRMADAAYLLEALRRRGYTVERREDGLSVTPGSRLTEGEREEIKEWKPELVVLLLEGK